MKKKSAIIISIILMLAGFLPHVSSISLNLHQESLLKDNIDEEEYLIGENPNEDFTINYIQKDEEIQISLKINDYIKTPKIIDNKVYYSVNIGEESQILDKGCPDLPNICRSFIIPNDKKMMFKIIESSYETVYDIDIAPSKGNIIRPNSPENTPYEFGEIYNEDTWYPKNIVELRDPYILRDFRGQTICLQPFQYNPVKRILRVYTSITFDFIPDGPGEINVLKSPTVNEKRSISFNNIYENLFYNYGDFGYTPVSEEGNMLIICYNDFYDDMQPFVSWKNMKGIPTEIINVSDAGSTATNIKNYIVNYYNSNGLTFVLLVGDIDQVPTINIGSSASDPSYGFITGSDSYPEVFVGRFSAQNSIQLDTMINRTLAYEKNPVLSLDWYNKGVGIGSNEGGPGTGKGDDNEADWQHIRNIRADLLNFTYTLVDELYDGSHGGEDASGNPSSSDVSTSVNDGRSIINYCGHGSYNGWSTTGFSTSNVNSLINDNMLPFIISVACNNGQFDDYSECFCEAWQRATHNGVPTGAIAITGSSISMSWDPPMDGQDEMNDLLTEQYPNNIMHTIGGIHANGCMHMNDEYGSSGYTETDFWHIFGDPSLIIRTDIPANMTVTHSSILITGTTAFEVNVADTENALCAVSINNILLGFGYTDENGECIINFDQPIDDIETVTLVVTAFNKNPYITTIDVLPPVRQPAEFEPIEGVLIRYPFGINYDVIAEMSEDVEVITIVSSESQKNTVENLYQSNSVNTDHTSYLIAPSDSYWTRDYGPWFIFNQTNKEFEVVDFEYNRPSRPNDNNIPYRFALNQSLIYNYMDIVHTGGNYMTDGQGISVSTDLVWTENPTMTPEEINQTVSQYLGIETYHVRPDVNNEYIKHIDCWGKYLSHDTIMIREVPITHSQYDEIEDAVDYFESQLSCYGKPYNVVRVYTPNNEPYTNSLILNDKVLVPQTGSQWDDDAILSYQNAMPGYEVLGFTGSWESTDALHCRVKGIPDRDMLYIEHTPSCYYLPSDDGFYIEAQVIAYSDTNLLSSSPKIFWKNSTGIWNDVAMTNVGEDIYGGYIPSHPCGETIYYYINAQDESGRNENHPYIGASDPHSFNVTLVPDIWIDPLSIDLIGSADFPVNDLLTIGNHEFAGETLDFSLSCTDNEGYGWLSVDTTSGSILVNETMDILVTANTTGLSIGDYFETININCNDPDEPSLIIPVYLTIIYSNDIGVVSVNSPKGTLPNGFYTVNATIKNYGIQDQVDLIVNCTIMEGIFGTFIDEDFSGSFLPQGWSQEEPNEWTQHESNNAGGLSPEAYLFWDDINGDYACLDSKPVNTIGAPSLKLTFNHSIDQYIGFFNCRVFARANTLENWMEITPWSNPVSEDISAEQRTIDITSYIGAETQVRFEFSGDNYCLYEWSIDDVLVYSPESRLPGDIVYTVEDILNINALTTEFIEFTPPWEINTNGFYAIKITTKLADDQDSSNDVCIGPVEIFEDTSPPVLSNINDFPDPQIVDGFVNISVTAIDETIISSVYVDITGPTGFTPVNVSMALYSSDGYYYNNNYSVVGNYSYFIWACDTIGHSISSSTYNFTILDESCLSVDITFNPGWNLISIPLVNDLNASDLAYNITSCISVSCWDAIVHTYETFIVGGPPSFDFEIEAGCGYFVEVAEQSTLTMVGISVISVNIPLKVGWNLLGWFYDYDTSAISLSENITGCISVSCWNASLQTYDTYIVGGPPSFDFTISCGMGLFVEVTTESIWFGEG